MKKFLINIFLFSIPIILLYLFPLLFFILGKEAVSYKLVAKKQLQQNQIIFGRAYSNVDQKYKIFSTKLRNADVLALGSSRIMTIRSEFFNPNIKFYNAGGGAQWPSDLNLFLNSLPPNKKPKLILLAADQRWFNPDAGSGIIGPNESANLDDSAFKDFFIYYWQKIYEDFFHKKINLVNLFKNYKNETKIGTGAVINNNGFRNDGSYFYGGYFRNQNQDEELKDLINKVVEEIKPNQNNFEYDNKINKSSLVNLKNFLSDCQKNNITVVGFLPPYAKAIYEKIQITDSQDVKTAEKLKRELTILFSDYNYSFYDFSDMSIFEGNDNELIDPVHGSDITSAKILIYLAEKNENIAKIINSEDIKNRLKKTSSNLEIYNN